MKRNIAIVAGGYSSEVVVSLKSAEGIYSFLDHEMYNVYIVLISQNSWTVKVGDKEFAVNKNDFSCIIEDQTVRFDFAYITIHGTPGENGLLQGYFEMLGIPYSSCNVFVSALTFNKYACNQYLKSFGIPVASSMHLFEGQQVDSKKVIENLGLPVFIKPNDGGSSFGVTKVKTEADIQPAIMKAFNEGKEVVIESFISGTEVTCGCYKVKEEIIVFPITEVVTSNEFFDYDAKYNGQVDEITPARISSELTEKIQSETARIYGILGAKGIIRVDYIITADGTPKLLEINTTPGMTATSFIPQQVRAAGLDIKAVMSDIIENEFN